MMTNINAAFNQAANSYGNSLGEPVRAEPEISVEFARFAESLRCLEEQAEWLLNKIAPICQPSNSMPTGANEVGQQIKAAPSQLRTDLISLRMRVDSVCSRLASVKYTIEV